MFGVVPKSIWQKTNPADANNMIDIAARCLLLEDGDRLILIDTGMGDKQSDTFFNYYYRWGDFTMDSSLAKHGFHRDDVTDVFMTHLHFDHCGGSIRWNKDRSGLEPAFKNATFWTNEAHWQWAIAPNAREKASFLNENLLPMKESGRLRFVPNNTKIDSEVASRPSPNYLADTSLGFGIHFVDGHTEKMMLPQIEYKGNTLVFVADLIPTVGHIPVPYVMGYDTRPLLTLTEKERFLGLAAEKGYLLFFEHDAHNEICNLQATDKGVRVNKTYTFNELFA